MLRWRGSTLHTAYAVAPSTYAMLDPHGRSTDDSRDDACRNTPDHHDDLDRDLVPQHTR